MGLEIASLLVFQVIFGNLYLWLSAFVTLFLLGGACGAYLSTRLGWSAPSRIRAADAAILVGSIALLLVVRGGAGTTVVGLRVILGGVALPALAFLLALPAGAQFAAAGEGVRGSSLAQLYWADLAGAAFGTIGAGLLLLPRFGVEAVIYGVVGVKTLSLLSQSLAARHRGRTI
jgi:spermidine synthase